MIVPPHVLAAIRQPAFVYRQEGSLEAANDLAEALAGRPLAGMTPADVIACLSVRRRDGTPLPPSDLPAARALQGEEMVNVPLTVTTDDGRTIHVLATASPIRDGDTVAGALSVWQDVTDQVESKQTLRHIQHDYLALLDHSLLAFARCRTLFDADGVPNDFEFVEVNEAYLAMTGFSDIVGRRITEIVPDMERDLIDLHNEVAVSGTSIQTDVYSSPLDRWYHVNVYSPGPGEFVSLSLDITGRKRTEEALQESEAKYRELFATMDEGFALHELVLDDGGAPVDYRFLAVNPAFEAMTGLAAGEIVGRTAMEVLPGLEPGWVERYGRVATTGEPASFESYSAPLDRWYVVHASSPGPGRFATRAEEALRESEERYRQLFEMESDAIFLIDNETGRILEANEAASELYGFSREELRGLRNVDLSAEPESTRARTREGASEIPLRWHRKRDGSIFPVEIMARHFDWRGRRVHIAAIRDITQRRRAEEQLRFLSLHDALTGLFNRARFEEELDRLDRRREGAVGILMVDVDGLKLANDTFGHERGDALLIEAARVLQDSLREGDLIARIGGDEFAALLPEIRGDDLDRVVARIRSNLEAREKREDPAGPPLVPRFSLGTALSASPAEPLRDVLRIADDRMYRDKLHRQGNARSAVLSTLTSLLAERDYVTEGHGERMADLTLALAEKVGFPEAERGDLVLFARFHDLGKVGIPDRILKKPGPLTPEETREMRRHPEVGRRIAHSLPELQPVAEWILLHHEWWNGGGYPLGLEGERIPLACRVLAVVDAFDAMTGDRPYRRALSEEEALEEIRRGAGSQFDPDLAAAFVRLVESGGLRGDRAGEQGRYAGRAGIAGEEETRT